MMRHILLAINGATESAKAEDLALYMARISGAALSVLYVRDDRLCHYGQIDPLASDQTKGAFIAYIESETDAECRRAMKRFSEKAALERIAFKTRIRSGDPAREIVSEASEHTADLIIIGADRPSRRILPASTVVGNVLKQSPCPVLCAVDDV